MFNPARAADEIKKEYIGYIGTTFHFRDKVLQKNLEKSLESFVSNGPFVEIKDSFKTGLSMRQLIDNGVLSPLFEELEKEKKYPPRLPIDRPLYKHQEQAISKIVSGRNVVVSTGTGSGKTHCFLIPVINELLREKENDTLNDGVRAIFIYPMNALANDQIKGVREILMAYPDIRFGVYNGATEEKKSDGEKTYRAMFCNERYPELKDVLPNEAISRSEMKSRPPHILFTNYAMLEHMLFRPGDDAIFSKSNFKFVVLDEAHVYSGATGIETSFLMGRLKGRMHSEVSPQFILTSATLGDGSPISNQRVVEFANQLTGCEYCVDDIVLAERENAFKTPDIKERPIDLFSKLADDNLFFNDVLKQYGLKYDYSTEKEPEILYDLISSSGFYVKMRQCGGLTTLSHFASILGISVNDAVAFVSLCARARKGGKALIDIRYHFFLKALDGCYLALDFKDSLSLIRKDSFQASSGEEPKMFEVAVCDDCGEFAIVGKKVEDKLLRVNTSEEREFYQVHYDIDLYEPIDTNDSKAPKKQETEFLLCKNCGAIVAEDEQHNQWCDCGNTKPIRLIKLPGDKCLNCNGQLRRFNLGYDAATGVIATSLYEQIPEYTMVVEDGANEAVQTKNIFLNKPQRRKVKSVTGSQFLIFSDSRQGAAKFACFLGDMYKQFLRRRGIWNVIEQRESDYPAGVRISEFVEALINYFSSKKLFRKSNSDNAESTLVENRRNAWVAVLDELYNCNRDTSLVSLGRMSFEYLGNDTQIVKSLAEAYNLEVLDAKNYLNFLAFEIVRNGAIITEEETDINDADREYLFFSSCQRVVTCHKDDSLYNANPFVPTSQTLKDGSLKYYRSRKLMVTKSILGIDDDRKAAELIENYWGWLISDDNPFKLISMNGKGYCMKANDIKIHIGHNAHLWKCEKCGKVTQFNMKGRCCQIGCEGSLIRMDSEQYCEKNYYASLYKSKKVTPLFVKEHTAQLAKKDALDYQQQFIRKEINALSCSTTFEMGVDVGDLETVFLRNIPPLASNYAQRVGRAGRSINAAAFALTYARLSSHDFTFFDNPQEMINGVIMPPNFNIDNEKILKRHVYAVSLSLYLKNNSDLYNGNNADKFINEKGYRGFVSWLNSHPDFLRATLGNSLQNLSSSLKEKYVDTFNWLDEFVGENGLFTKIVSEYEQNVLYLQREYNKALKAKDVNIANVFKRKLDKYQRNDLIDFLVRGNILPKYGFPIDSVELAQNFSSEKLKTLNLSRDLSVAIAEYAPSSEVVADGGLYTSRYIRKPIVNRSEMKDFETAYIAECPHCDKTNFSNMPVGVDGIDCNICGRNLKSRDFNKSIEPRAGFIAEDTVKEVPLSSQERKYKTEAIYIGDKAAHTINKYSYKLDSVDVHIESTANDSLVIKSTDDFYVCTKCGYAIAADENVKLNKYRDYRRGVRHIEDTDSAHSNPFGKGLCENVNLVKYGLHHEFKTDVAKISFGYDTSDDDTMLSVMYALLNAFANEMNIERRDIRACLTYKKRNGKMEHKIIIYDAVPGGAGHSRRLVTQDGMILKNVIKRAINLLATCNCSPSCYRCLRNYENQKIHERLNRQKALDFLLMMRNENAE